jgi:hypothetical protein
MRIAITDACIFIDLIQLQLTSRFFKLPLEIHTSHEVFNELNSGQQEILNAYISVDKLVVHKLSSTDWSQIILQPFPKSLSLNDKSVLYLAEKLDALVLSSDKPVRNWAKGNSIECHGIFWILDYLVESELITSSDAIAKLKLLISKNIIYQNNTELESEIAKRLQNWSKSK